MCCPTVYSGFESTAMMHTTLRNVLTIAFGFILLSVDCEPARSQALQVPGAGPQVAAVPTAALQPSEVTEQFTPADYLAAAERLTLRFKGYPELTGDYRVSPDHTISIPVVGRV